MPHPLRRIAVVLFAFDEKGNLLRLLRRLQAALQREAPDAELQYCICIQGKDGTIEEAKAFQEEVGGRARVALDYAPEPVGVRNAAIRAFGQVEGTPDAYLMMDCDLNHQPEELGGFLRLAAPDTVVVGSRFCPGGKIVGMPHWKRILSSMFNSLTAVFLRVPVRDKTSGYRLIVGSGVSDTARQVTGAGFDFYIEFLLRLHARGMRIVETPICFLVRTEGESKMRFFKTIRDYVKLIWRLRNFRSAKGA